MKKFCIGVLVLVMFITLSPVNTCEAKADWPKGPSKVSAEGAVVIDLKSGMVLFEKNMNKELYPASITKVMTALLAIENSTLNETVTYSASAVLGLEAGASTANPSLQVGEKLTMLQSLYAIMLPSANEACLGVAEHISGSVPEFVKMMNKKAKSLGCKNTHFNNPNGLWQKNHYTSPYDMALIMREAMKNDTFRMVAGSKGYHIPKTNKSKKARDFANHHQMIFPLLYPQYGYEYAVAGKTGYTFKSGATLVTCAKKGDMELVCVVMKTKSSLQGQPNIYTDTIKLFNYCFEKFSQYTIDDSIVSQIAEEYLFTKFSPFFASDKKTLSLESVGSVILPKKVPLSKATKKVDYYTEPAEKNGKKVIGKLAYFYNGKEAGGTNILYNKKDHASLLVDSLDMNEWMDDAVEKASTPAFPWKNILLIILVSAVVALVLAVLIMYVQAYRIKKRTKKSYKKAEMASLSRILHRKK